MRPGRSWAKSKHTVDAGMEVIRLPGARPWTDPPPVVATIGNFDGVHLGHRQLLDHVNRRAREAGVRSAVITFDPHPRLVIRPDDAPRLLSTLDERIVLFDRLGIDLVVVWRFDAALQRMDAETFFRQLSRHVALRRLIHGPSFALGRRRHATAGVIAEIGRRMAFDVEEISPYIEIDAGSTADGPAAARAPGVTSTAIRALIECGDITQAARALGRPPSLCGTVIEGAHVGRTIGFPTTNLAFEAPMAIPADGVYAAWADVDPFGPEARRFPAAVSIGSRPTFGGQSRVVEAHLLDFAGELYGRQICLHFMRRLRGQERYDGVDALVAQMKRDVEATREALAHDHGGRVALPAGG